MRNSHATEGTLPSNKGSRTLIRTIFGLFMVLTITPLVFPASTPTNQLFKQLGAGNTASNGDYISANDALRTYYRYFIEVPPGTGRLVVRIFDADIGQGGGSESNDWQTGGSWNTSVTYRLYDPSGGTVSQDFTTGSASAPSGADGSWTRLYRENNPATGHWELRVDMSNAVTSGDDMNGYGIRAVDNINGTELNVYAESFVPLGALGTQTTTLYPYVTSGCTVDWNDWDGDNDGTTYCTFSYGSRTGNRSGSFNGSGATVWLNTAISAFSDDFYASDYGIWSTDASYTGLSGSNANFGVLYIGAFNAANPPPTAQPEANTFRIYLPSSTGPLPLKPFLTQHVSHVSGPNPPAVGSTTRVRIQIAMANPTPHAITFSAANLVQAVVPGAGAVYAGNAVVSTGSITAQPALGGTGTISWNPSSVAGTGSGIHDETLSYDVDVTPTSSGQQISVTGNPASGGTTATFVDETGNTSQTRANFTFGPLCELAVTEGGGNIPTLAVVTGFSSELVQGKVILRWRTASELTTAGFCLQRLHPASGEYETVEEGFLPGLLHDPAGGDYEIVDETADPVGRLTYRLLEIESSGATRIHGPFAVTPTQRFGIPPGYHTGKPTAPRTTTLRGYNRSLRSRPVPKVRTPRPSAPTIPARIPNSARLKIRVKTDGITQLSAALIGRRLGLATHWVEMMIHHHRFRLHSGGLEIPWTAAPLNGGIWFYGRVKDDPFSDHNVYWLSQGEGLHMGEAVSPPPQPGQGGHTFTEHLHVEEDHYALSALFRDPASDIWFWDFIEGGGEPRTFRFASPGASGQGEASMTLHLQGATATAATPDHHLTVEINGVVLGTTFWDGTKAHRARFTVDPSLLRDEANTLTVRNHLAPDVPYSIVYLDGFDLTYRRSFRPVGHRLTCRGDGKDTVTVEGFLRPEIFVFDVSRPDEPRIVSGTVIDGAYRISFVPESPAHRYFVVAPDGVIQAGDLSIDRPSRLRAGRNQADAVLIVPQGWSAAARRLVQLHRRRGLDTRIVIVDDIYDEFNHGVPSPLAIRTFLAHARAHWLRGPRYAILAGHGTYDYKDHQAFGDNLIPPPLVSTPWGLFASDTPLADVEGDDNIPDLVIGRIPVRLPLELTMYITRLERAITEHRSTGLPLLFAADRPDDGGDFVIHSDRLASLAGHRFHEKIYLGEFDDVADARERLIEAVHTGAALLNYVGHAGMDRLSAQGLLRSEDLSRLTSRFALPLFTAFSCVVGRFAVPGFDSLAEDLVVGKNGCVLTAWVPVSASGNTQACTLAEAFYTEWNENPRRSIGDIILEASRRFITAGGDPRQVLIQTFLGDPTLMIH